MSLESDFLSLFSPPFPATKEAAAEKWADTLAPHMGGGGADGWTLANKPAVPHPDDEEFEGGLDAWTVSSSVDHVNGLDPYAKFASGGVRVSLNALRPSWLLMQADASGSTPVVISKPVSLASDVFVWTRMMTFRRGGVIANDSTLYLLLRAADDPNGTQNSLRFYLIESDGSPALQIDRVVGGVTSVLLQSPSTGAAWNEVEYLGIHRRGSDYHFWVAPPSGQWRWLLKTTHSETLAQVAVVAGNTSSADPGNAVTGVDFIRFLEGGGPP